jgi:hypothetical protein
MKIKWRSLFFSILIVAIIYYLIFILPVVDDVTLPIRAVMTSIILGGGFCFWILVFYVIIGILEKRRK